MTDEFTDYRQYIIDDYFEENILPAMQRMTNQLSAISIQQVQIIGSFFDAKHQLETQRLFQTLVSQAHKDYHPSEELCTIGTATRSLASSQRRSELTQLAFANRMMDRQILSKDTVAGNGSEQDLKSRFEQYIQLYCDPSDNAGQLDRICGAGGPVPRRNIDVNYTNALENKLTLDIDFTGPEAPPASDDEQNIFALGANLFAHRIPPLITNRLLANENHDARALTFFYMRQRAIAAKRSVAQNSFAALAAMRAAGNAENAPFLKAMIRELGIEDDAIIDYIGANPSYFAQMEILTKKIYQNPKFYADLYDKPVNIDRKGAALQAIALMQDRDIYDSLIRSEAVLATLLETLIRKEHDRVSRNVSNVSIKDETVNN